MKVKVFREVPPNAGPMIDSLRGVGYDPETAIADIVDNSISAFATEVNINFVWDRESSSRIEIIDNGIGMSDSELEEAMRLGVKGPKYVRAKTDLGRFGMGLKTASFSQCKRLTVGTVKESKFSCLRWDLDYLEKQSAGKWQLLEGSDEASEVYFESFKNRNSGTFVLLEELDKIVQKGSKSSDFLDVIDKVDQHLGMVFHRYLSDGKKPVKIRINGREVNPWDPFMEGHVSKAWSSPVATFSASPSVKIECHVLPHRDKLTDREHQTASGPDGWLAQQGFYIYRNERLLVPGSWLGLDKSWMQDELHQLARIRVDLTNYSDDEWKIDIKKSQAVPPIRLRKWLARYGSETRKKARSVFVHRGGYTRQSSQEEIEAIWQVKKNKNGTSYKIDRSHSLIKGILNEFSVKKQSLDDLFKLIENTVPVKEIWLESMNQQSEDEIQALEERDEKIQPVLSTFYNNLINVKGMSPSIAKKQLHNTQPFCNYPKMIDEL